MTEELQVGDIVRVKNPDDFISTFARKITDRDAVVIWVGPDSLGMNKGIAGVIFQKRNGRGKEFRERMSIRELQVVKKINQGDAQ